jgi:hypothetical protein
MPQGRRAWHDAQYTMSYFKCFATNFHVSVAAESFCAIYKHKFTQKCFSREATKAEFMNFYLRNLNFMRDFLSFSFKKNYVAKILWVRWKRFLCYFFELMQNNESGKIAQEKLKEVFKEGKRRKQRKKKLAIAGGLKSGKNLKCSL